jgi:hypothetical protein
MAEGNILLQYYHSWDLAGAKVTCCVTEPVDSMAEGNILLQSYHSWDLAGANVTHCVTEPVDSMAEVHTIRYRTLILEIWLVQVYNVVVPPA